MYFYLGKKYYRAVFKSPINPDTPNVVERNITLGHGNTHEYCSKEVIYLKTLQDIQNSVKCLKIIIKFNFLFKFIKDSF